MDALKESLAGRPGIPFFTLTLEASDIITLDISGHDVIFGPYGWGSSLVCFLSYLAPLSPFITPINSSP